MFSVAKDFKSMLGNVRYDNETGRIVAAGVTNVYLYGKMNVSAANLDMKNESFLGNQVTILSFPIHLTFAVISQDFFQISLEKLDRPTEELENAMIQILTEIQTSGNVSLNFNVQKGFEVSVNSRIFGDIPKAIGSFAIMFFYVSFNLGKLKLNDNRYYLSQVLSNSSAELPFLRY